MTYILLILRVRGYYSNVLTLKMLLHQCYFNDLYSILVVRNILNILLIIFLFVFLLYLLFKYILSFHFS